MVWVETNQQRSQASQKTLLFFLSLNNQGAIGATANLENKKEKIIFMKVGIILYLRQSMCIPFLLLGNTEDAGSLTHCALACERMVGNLVVFPGNQLARNPWHKIHHVM